MAEFVKLWEKPAASEVYMLAGWEQWADAGNISSGLPAYLIEHTNARQIGQLNLSQCYLFQLPGAHHFLRPEIKLSEGYREELSRPVNDLHYAEISGKGLVIFSGVEPHLAAEVYAEAFMTAVKQLGVRRVIALGGVYASMPYDAAREFHCVYSLPGMKEELAKYAVKFSDYQGGVTISTYLLDRAEQEGIEFTSFYGFVPAYDLPQASGESQGIRIETDYRAWYEVMQRINHMCGTWWDLSDLEQQSRTLTEEMEARVDELDRALPQLGLREQMQTLRAEYNELPFIPLDSMWERELNDILGQMDDEP